MPYFNIIIDEITDRFPSLGHVAKDCTAHRTLNWTGVEDLSPEAAWNSLKEADDERDLDDFRSVRQIVL